MEKKKFAVIALELKEKTYVVNIASIISSDPHIHFF